jgi:ribulose kinase
MLSTVIAFGTRSDKQYFARKISGQWPKLLWLKALPQSTWKNTLPPPQHILDFLVLVEVGLVNRGPTFATTKWVVLIEWEMKVASNLLHIFDSLRTFGLILPHLKLLSANKILVEKLFPTRA